MLGSRCGPCCNCSVASTAAIVDQLRGAKSVVFEWESADLKYQEAASFGVDGSPVSQSQPLGIPYSATVYAQGKPPQSSLAMALAGFSSSGVSFESYGIDTSGNAVAAWRVTASFNVVSARDPFGSLIYSRWPGTECAVYATVSFYMYSLDTLDPRYFLSEQSRSLFYWVFPATYTPPPSAFVSQEQPGKVFFSARSDLSGSVQKMSAYSADACPQNLSWQNSNVFGAGIGACAIVARQDGLASFAAVTLPINGVAEIAAEPPDSVFTHPARWGSGNLLSDYGRPAPGSAEALAYQGRITKMKVRVTL